MTPAIIYLPWPAEAGLTTARWGVKESHCPYCENLATNWECVPGDDNATTFGPLRCPYCGRPVGRA